MRAWKSRATDNAAFEYPPNPYTAKMLTLFCRTLGELSSLPETEFKSISPVVDLQAFGADNDVAPSGLALLPSAAFLKIVTKNMEI
jgi:hypothetical protein